MLEWHIVTCEYPSQIGGVSDYTYLVASGLAQAGDSVHIWCPSYDGKILEARGVTVHPEWGDFSPPHLARVGRFLNQFPKPRHLFIQWVPHGYGLQSMNLPFCLWLLKRSVLNHDKVEIMVHEPFLAFEGSWRQYLAASVHRLMTVTLLKAASRVWVAGLAWEQCWKPYTLGRKIKFDWLPVPSTVPRLDAPLEVANVRSCYASKEQFLLGHLGTYGKPIADLLKQLLPPLLANHLNRVFLLLGRDSDHFRHQMIQTYPFLSKQVHATGVLSSSDLSYHFSACDVMVQPYPDGVSGRRTSVMAALSHGKPVVTTQGRLTESVWAEGNAVRLVPTEDMMAMIIAVDQLLASESERRRMAEAARRFYENRFDIRHTILALRNRIS